MNRSIKKVAVLGSGVMGSRIACHFANIGVDTVLLDIVPRELNDKEKAKGLTLESPQVRNRLVDDALKFALKSKPSPVYDKKEAVKLITTGNFEDNMELIADCDWVIEVVVERLDIKQKVFEQVEKYRKPGTLITSNTSGIPMQLMTEGCSEDFRQHFCGTHFFNPPRYLRLLEIIPAPDTKPEIIDFLMHYGDLYLGKEMVLCKDTPAFIANRIGVYAIMSGMHTIEKMDLTVAEVDKLTGPVIGRPKSATFRTTDVVGLDTMVNVSNNLYAGLKNDESKKAFKLPDIVQKVYDQGWLGDKSGQGYYKKTKDEKGKRKILELNLKTFEYEEKGKPKFDVLNKTKDIDNLRDRFSVLLADEGKAGEFYRESFYDLFRYCSNRIPEIADEVFRIDQGVRAGFGRPPGTNETWHALCVNVSVCIMEEAGHKPAQWVYDMLESGVESFYKVENGQRKFYDIGSKEYKVIPGTEEFILLDTLRDTNVVWSNPGSTIFDLGDGILGLEFHTKMNAIGAEIIEGINTAISMAEKDYRGLVIGNEAEQFSAGANLSMIFMFAAEQEYDEINMMIAQFQKTIMRARYSSIPVVAAPAGLTLGGGCELTLHADHVQANAETYIGLVEFGVGLIPAGGGTKEMTLRASDSYASGDPEYNRLLEVFMNIATAKVATSAEEGRGLGYIREQDSITLNRSRLLADAKRKAIEMAEEGYTQPVERTDIKVQGRGGMAMFEAGITGMIYGNYVSEHDAKIARRLAYVMNGGDLSQPTMVSEQYLLDLEREAFLSLAAEKKTMERVQSILTTGKPLRN